MNGSDALIAEAEAVASRLEGLDAGAGLSADDAAALAGLARRLVRRQRNHIITVIERGGGPANGRQSGQVHP